MPDNTTAAVWFTENFLTDFFQTLARTKKYDITAFNQKFFPGLRAIIRVSTQGNTATTVPSFSVPGPSQPHVPHAISIYTRCVSYHIHPVVTEQFLQPHHQFLMLLPPDQLRDPEHQPLSLTFLL